VPAAKPNPHKELTPWPPKADAKRSSWNPRPVGHFYTTSKNKKTMPEKMSIMKFDPKARKHVEYKEIKLK